MVKVENLTKTFTDEVGAYNVLKGTSFSIEKGDMVALTGVSGAGKTTLLQILGGLDKATSGNILINDIELAKLDDNGLARFRRENIGFVFQFHHLLPDFTAVENVLMPGIINGKRKSDCIERAKYLLSTMGLERLFSHYPAELSGGERQRVALARALFNEPVLILADEPTGNLDTKNSKSLIEMFQKANEETNQTFLIATHNNLLSDGMHRKIVIEDGKIIDQI